MNCPSISEWSNFLAVQAEAAATLTGLVFVAVSLNLSKILNFPGLSGRAAESIMQLVEVFFIASALLIAGEPPRILALTILIIGLIFWAAQTWGQVRYLRSRTGHPWSWFLIRTILGQLATVPSCIAGILLIFGFCNGIYWLIPAFFFSFAASLLSAWVLLVEIVR